MTTPFYGLEELPGQTRNPVPIVNALFNQLEQQLNYFDPASLPDPINWDLVASPTTGWDLSSGVTE